MKKSIRFLAFLLVGLTSFKSEAQFRKYSNEFLNIGAGAKGLSLGGAQVAGTGDATSGYWNPAGLTEVKDFSTGSIMHAEYFAGIGKYDFAAVALPIGDPKYVTRTLGISLMRFAVDDIPNTLFLVEPDGTINYNNIKSFSSSDYAFLLSYAQVIYGDYENTFSIGANAKIIHRSVGSFAKAWGFGLDAGVQYRTKKFGIGIVAKDVTTTFNAWNFRFTEKEKEALYLAKNDIPIRSIELTAPRLVLGGFYYTDLSTTTHFMTEMNLDLTFGGRRNVLLSSSLVNLDPKMGIEVGYKKTVFGRLGIYNFQRGLRDGDTTNLQKVWIYQPGMGVGFKVKNVEIDYAFTNLANQSNPLYTHLFSLKFVFPKNQFAY